MFAYYIPMRNMLEEIERLRLALGLNSARLLLLANWSAKREVYWSVSELTAVEQYDLMTLLDTMLEHGRHGGTQAAMAG